MQIFKLAIFISGKGTNAIKLIDFFDGHPNITINLVVSNNPTSPCLTFCQKNGIDTVVCDNFQASDPNFLLEICKKYHVDFIVLAGYLRKIPVALIDCYSDKIFNIHPSLLPSFGGIGMYGDRVHHAVLQSGGTKSGITIHLVNEEYDRGRILAQFECILNENENLESLKEKISKLEHENYGGVITKFILGTHE